MALFHKPRPGPGLSFRPFVLHRSKLLLFLKFLLGLIAGIFFMGQLQISLITSGACIQFKLSPLHRQLKVKTLESADVETTGRQLLLVGVMTADKYIGTRAKAVYETWGNRVPGKILFFTADTQNSTEDLPVIPLRGVDDSYPPQKKSFMMLKYMSENYGDKFEWFMRADDDVFVKTDRLELFLRSINSSRPVFIGQAGKGSQEEFGLLSLEYDENYCMGGPGMVLSHATLARVAPHVKDCLHNLYTTHEDVELGRCVQKYAGIPCTWSYEMESIFHHNFSNRMAFTGPLKSREVHRAITLHPVKENAHMYRIHNYLQGLAIRNNIFEGLKIRREMAASIQQLNEQLSSSLNVDDHLNLQTLGRAPNLNKYQPKDISEILPWNFVARSIDSMETVNPRRAIDPSLREGVEDVIREVMEGINLLSKERGRIIDFKELLYGYYRVNPKFGVDYILDLLLSYKKYRGRKMMFPVRRHAYLQQPFGPLVVRKSPSSSGGGAIPAQRIHFVVPLAGRLPIFERFMDNFRRVCLESNENVRLVVVLFPTMAPDDPLEEIRELLATYRLRFHARNNFELHVIERKESFARAAALELGASSCPTEDCLLFFIDVDMVFNKQTLYRIRKHTIRHRQMYFPIVFSQYDPSFEDDNPESMGLNQIHSSTFDIDDSRGYWRFYGFGITSLYRSDLKRVGGMNLTIHGWGKEDVDLFDRVVSSNLTVFRAADPGLIHIFHPIECDVNLETKQRTMCQGSLANTYASQRRLAQYWIDHHLSS